MSVLSPEARSEVAQLIARILADDDPSLLLTEVGRLHDAFRLQEAAEVFEAVLFRNRVTHYWVFYRMCDVYTRIGRDDAAFFCANIAIGLEPNAPSWHLYRTLYTYFRHKGRDEDAVEAYLRQIERTPEDPIVGLAEVRPLLAALGHPLAADPIEPPAASTVVHRLEEPSFTTPIPGPFYGSAYPLTLRPYRQPYARPPVDVVEIHNAQVLIYNNNVVICSEDGQIYADLSVGELPGIIAHWVRSHAEDAVQQKVGTAAVVLDRFPAPNLCHFLLDQMTRLDLYRRLGAEASNITVIGPSADTHYQKAILARFGVINYIATTQLCIVRAECVLVSRTCRMTHMHPAHGGAPWALDCIRNVFGITQGELRNRIYISRADAKGRNIVNGSELVVRLKQAGFVEIVASSLSFDDQVELFRNASHVVAMHGAGLTNIVFCPQGAHILEFFHPLYGSPAYGQIAPALGLDYRPFVARDALSSDSIYNDPDQSDFSVLGFAGRATANNRDIYVDLALVDEWLAEVEGANAERGD